MKLISMPLRPLSHKEVERKLTSAGFIRSSKRGSHIKYMKTTDEGIYTTIVPEHKSIAIGTLRSVIRQAGMSVDEFMEL